VDAVRLSLHRGFCRIRAQHDPATGQAWPQAGGGSGQEAWQASHRQRSGTQGIKPLAQGNGHSTDREAGGAWYRDGAPD